MHVYILFHFIYRTYVYDFLKLTESVNKNLLSEFFQLILMLFRLYKHYFWYMLVL